MRRRSDKRQERTASTLVWQSNASIGRLEAVSQSGIGEALGQSEWIVGNSSKQACKQVWHVLSPTPAEPLPKAPHSSAICTPTSSSMSRVSASPGPSRGYWLAETLPSLLGRLSATLSG